MTICAEKRVILGWSGNLRERRGPGAYCRQPHSVISPQELLENVKSARKKGIYTSVSIVVTRCNRWKLILTMLGAACYRASVLQVGASMPEGIKVLAYVQFGTLYFEVMRNEIPNLEDWAARDINGRPIPYIDNPVDYYRWMPCLTQEKFPAYLEKVLKIGIEQAEFDGFLLDNCLGSACYCPRCVAKFREYLTAHYDPADFGLSNFRFAAPPSEAACAAPSGKIRS